jgi:neurotransmitter:Na+ symporter, NSS family
MQKSERVNFGSKIGAVLAAAGSAVGLGNIWRFPYETGNHGGAAFILVYLACVFMLGMPIMIAEFTVGRHSKASTGRAYKVLAPGTHWKWLGYLGVLAGFLILGYYSVVAGWTLEYILEAGMNGFADKKPEDFVVAFQSERWNREIFEGADACFVCTDSSFGGVLIVASQCGKRFGVSAEA